MRRRAGSRPTRTSGPFRSSRSRPMGWPAMPTRRGRRAAMPTFPSLTVRVSSWRKSASTCPQPRRRADRMTRVEFVLRTTAVMAVLLPVVIAASAAEQNMVGRPHEPDFDKTSATGTPCLFDPERGQVPNCIHEGKAGELFVAPQYLKALNFDAHGLAAVSS